MSLLKSVEIAPERWVQTSSHAWFSETGPLSIRTHHHCPDGPCELDRLAVNCPCALRVLSPRYGEKRLEWSRGVVTQANCQVLIAGCYFSSILMFAQSYWNFLPQSRQTT